MATVAVFSELGASWGKKAGPVRRIQTAFAQNPTPPSSAEDGDSRRVLRTRRERVAPMIVLR